MKLFILGLILIAVVTFFAYRKKIQENMTGIENSYKQESSELYSALAKAGDPDASSVPAGKSSTTDFIKIQNDLTTDNNYRKIRDAKFENVKVDLAIPKGDVSDKMNSCKQITKCSQLSNGDCGYCVYTKEFKYGGSGGPAADVCPANAWTNNPNKCEEMREKAICKEVKSCGDLTGEAAELCAWCPTSGRAVPFKQAGNKKVPKYPDDICNNAGYGVLDAKECQQFLKDHPCLTPTAFSGPHSPACLSQLWKKAIGKDRRTIDWMKYSKDGFWNTRGYPAVLSDMKAWKAYTRSSDYATAVKGGLMCYGKKPDPCNPQFKPKPAECMDQLWKEGGGQTSGTGLPSKAGVYRSGESPYKNTIGGYQYTLEQAKEACRKEGARLCRKSEIMDKNICNAGWTADGIRGYPMVDGGPRGCGGSRKGWRTWSTNPNSRGSAHCCYQFNTDNSKKTIIDTTKFLADKAISGNATQQAGLMKMVYGKNWTPPPAPKPGDLVQLNWKEGSISAWHRGYIIQKMGQKCSIMWTDYKGRWSQDRYKLKNDPAGLKTQRYWFGWPGIRPQALAATPTVDAGGLVLVNHLKVIKRCSNAPSNCGLNCKRIIRDLLERFPSPQDCVVSNWSGWSPCSKKCGEGIQSRSRSVKYPPKHNGLPCPPLTEKRTCETRPCYPANYKGCYRDCKGGRDLPTFVGDMSKQQCADEARRRNSKYYGLQYQNGVGGGSRDRAQCFLGNSYGSQGSRDNCKNLGPQKNIPYGQSCSNAVYENENYKPAIYKDEGNKYCVGYSSYKRFYNAGNEAACKAKCDEDPNCNAMAFSAPGRRRDRLQNSCITYQNCTITPNRQNWGFKYYSKPGTSVNWGGRSWMQKCDQYTSNVGPYKSKGGQYLANACQTGYDKGCVGRFSGAGSARFWERTACKTGERLKDATEWKKGYACAGSTIRDIPGVRDKNTCISKCEQDRSCQCVTWMINNTNKCRIETGPATNRGSSAPYEAIDLPKKNLSLRDVNVTARNLELCEGDCDRDSDCKYGLKCFQRNGYTSVPGCKGRGRKDWDYCIKK